VYVLLSLFQWTYALMNKCLFLHHFNMYVYSIPRVYVCVSNLTLLFWIVNWILFYINSLEYSLWNAYSHSGNQKILCLLKWNPKVHYHVRTSLPFAPILNQVHPVYTFPPSFRKIHSKIILTHLHIGFPSDLFLLGFLRKFLFYISDNFCVWYLWVALPCYSPIPSWQE
jgi:hypothetical protein